MGTFIVQSSNFLLDTQIRNVDLAVLTDDERSYVCIVHPDDFTKTPAQMGETNICFNEFIKNGIQFEVPNESTGIMTTYGGKMNTSWNNLNTAFPDGFILLSPEQVIDNTILNDVNAEKSIVFRVYNNKNDSSYILNMGNLSTVLLYNDILNTDNPNKFFANYQVYTENNTAVGSPIALGPINDLRYKYTKNLSQITIPDKGYIDFKVYRTNTIQDIDVYLIISLTGITRAKPTINFDATTKTSEFEKQDKSESDIIVNIIRNIAGNSLNGQKLQLTFTNKIDSSKTYSPEPTSVITDNTLKYRIPNRLLPKGEYSVVAKYSTTSAFSRQYFDAESTTPMTYIITTTNLKTKLEVVTTSAYSYDSDITFKASVLDNDGNSYTFSSIGGTMLLYIKDSSGVSFGNPINMAWDTASSTYMITTKPSTLKLKTGFDYSFYTKFTPTNQVDYNYANTDSDQKNITIKGLHITTSTTDADKKIGLTQTLPITLKINDVDDITHTYSDIFSSRGDIRADVYLKSNNVLIGSNLDISSLVYIIDPRIPGLVKESAVTKLNPGEYYVIFRFISNSNNTNIIISDSDRFEFTIETNKLFITNTNLTDIQYRKSQDITITAVIKSNDIILTNNEITGALATPDIKFKIYDLNKTTDLYTSDTASYNQNVYTATISGASLKDASYKIIALNTTSQNTYIIDNSADVSLTFIPQTMTISVTKPNDALSVTDVTVLYNYLDDKFATNDDYIYEYGLNDSFTITGTINMVGGVDSDSNGNLELWLAENDNPNTYIKVEDTTNVIQTDTLPLDFTLTITSPSSLNILQNTVRNFYIKWVPEKTSLYNVCDSKNTNTQIKSLETYTIFQKDNDCEFTKSSISYEEDTTLIGRVIAYKRTSTTSDDPTTHTTRYVSGTYELKYTTIVGEKDTVSSYKSFGNGGLKVDNGNTDAASLKFSALSVYKNGTTNETLTVGTYYVRMFFTSSETGYKSCHSSRPRTITISQEYISTDASLVVYNKNNQIIPSSNSLIDNNTPIYLQMEKVVSKTKGTILTGTFLFSYGDANQLFPSGSSPRTPLFTANEKDIAPATTTFKVVFTPTDTNYRITTPPSIQRDFSKVLIPFESISISPSSVDYEANMVITAKLSPLIKGDDSVFSVPGSFSIFKDSTAADAVLLRSGIAATISSVNQEIQVFNGTPKLLGIGSGEYTSLTVVFIPTNSNIGPNTRSASVTVVAKQINKTLVLIGGSAIVSKIYDELFTVTTTIPKDIAGSIKFKISNVDSNPNNVTTIYLGEASVITSTGIATLSNICGYDYPGISTGLYKIVADFVSNDPNYSNGQVNQTSAEITFTKISVYLNELKINNNAQSTTSLYYTSGISLQAGNTIEFKGTINSASNVNKPVRSGKIELICKITSGTPLPSNYGTISEHGNFSFTLTAGPDTIPRTQSKISISAVYYLKYSSDLHYNTRDLYHNIAPPTPSVNVPGRYSISIDEIPYGITMNRTASTTEGYTTTDYHNGSFKFNVEIDTDLKSEAKTIYENYSNSGKGGFVFMIINSSGSVISRYETKPLFTPASTGNQGYTQASWSFCPKDITNVVNSTIGLQAGSYNMKCYFEGITGYYRAQDASASTGLYMIPFTVSKTESIMSSSLFTNVVDYKQQPRLSIKVQTPISSFNVPGETVLTYGPSSNPLLNQLLVTNPYDTNNTNGIIAENKITNIIDTKIVRMPVINANSSAYTLRLSFTPTDTMNYTIKSTELLYTVNKYTPDITSATISIKPKPDNQKGANVEDGRVDKDYSAGLINYDEPFEVIFDINKADIADAIGDSKVYNQGYANLTADILYKYKKINDANSNYTQFTKTTDFVSDYESSNNALKWAATIKKQKISYINGDLDLDYTLQITFNPTDTTNYNFKTVTSNFAIYIANELGTLALSNAYNVSVPIIYNVIQSFTVRAAVTYLTDVILNDRKAQLRLYNDATELATERITNSSNYYITLSTGDVDKLLTSQFSPYQIRGILDPDNDNYPSIKQDTIFSLQINPSVELSISNGSTTSPTSSEYSKTPFTISATIKTGNTKTYSGKIVFKIFKSGTIKYTRTVTISSLTNPVDNRVFNFKTDDLDIDSPGSPIYDFPVGEYTVKCDVTFNSNAYQPVTQNSEKTFTITPRIAPFSIELIELTNDQLTHDRIIYGETQPTITATFSEDNVYGADITFTFTHKTDLVLHNIPPLTYTLSTVYSSKKNVYSGIVLPSLMKSDEYTISAKFFGGNFGNSTCDKTIVFVVSKCDVILTSTKKYYIANSVDEKLESIILETSKNVVSGSITIINSSVSNSQLIKQLTSTTYTPSDKLFNSGEIILTELGISNAGSYEIAMYYNGDDIDSNFNKSPIVFANIVVKRKEYSITLSEPTYSASEYTYQFTVVSPYITSDNTVELYAISQVNSSFRLIHSTTIDQTGQKFTCPDSVFNKGDTQIYVVITNPKYIIKTSIVKISKLGIDVSSATLTSTPSASNTIDFNTPITLNATLVSVRQGVDVDDGRVIFYVKDDISSPTVYTTIGSTNVIDNVASLANVLLTKIGTNKICAKYMDSFIYNDFPSSGYVSAELTITLGKTTTTVVLSSSNSSPKITDVCTITAKVQIGTFVQSGTIQFKDGTDIIYDNVPVVNGEATISLYIDKAYTLTALYSGNEYLNKTAVSNEITLSPSKYPISSYYENIYTSKILYNTAGSSTASITITATISAIKKNPVYDNNGYFIFTLGSDIRKIYAKEITNTSDYSALSSYVYNVVDGEPTISVAYGNDNFSNLILFVNT